MNINNSVLQIDEKIIFSLRSLYSKYGYKMYRMSKFEEYDLYSKNKDFLVSDNVITFNDVNGKLMALKPDVTLSIIKNSKDDPSQTQKLFYNENVYRATKNDSSFKEIMQTGLECFGDVKDKDVKQVLSLAIKSLESLSNNNILAISNLDIIDHILTKLGFEKKSKADVYNAIGEKNISLVKSICESNNIASSNIEALCTLVSTYGPVDKIEEKLINTFDSFDFNIKYKPFISLVKKLPKEKTIIDFSIISDINYYNGVVFKGFISGIPSAIISGGQYDKLMKKMHRASKAIGFAVYTDKLDRLDDILKAETQNDDYLNIALPKGRLGEKIYAMFAKAGFECPSILEENRKLIFENEANKVRYFWVKPSDVAIYVERGAADIGVAGKDILLEYKPDIYELLDLKTGKCRMAVAGPKDFEYDNTKTLRVATKFSEVAQKFYLSQGRDIDIIHLNGSIELAPILGLSDVIVDIVETGTTLKENNLGVIEEIFPISARLIANKSAFKFKSTQIEKVMAGMSAILEAKND